MELNEEEIKKMSEIDCKYMFAEDVTPEEQAYYQANKLRMADYCRNQADWYEQQYQNYSN